MSAIREFLVVSLTPDNEHMCSKMDFTQEKGSFHSTTRIRPAPPDDHLQEAKGHEKCIAYGQGRGGSPPYGQSDRNISEGGAGVTTSLIVAITSFTPEKCRGSMGGKVGKGSHSQNSDEKDMSRHHCGRCR